MLNSKVEITRFHPSSTISLITRALIMIKRLRKIKPIPLSLKDSL
jgi:hypothetical protein